MQFCKDCGAVLNLFEFPDRELCSDCIRKTEQTKVTASPGEQENKQGQVPQTILPSSVQITAQNGKISVISEEGWTLWSGTASQSHELQTILKQAERIYAIRNRTKRDKK